MIIILNLPKAHNIFFYKAWSWEIEKLQEEEQIKK